MHPSDPFFDVELAGYSVLTALDSQPQWKHLVDGKASAGLCRALQGFVGLCRSLSALLIDVIFSHLGLKRSKVR